MNIWNDITLPNIAIYRYEKLERILISVCKDADVLPYMVKGRRRLTVLVQARVAFSRQAKSKGYTLKQIGKHIGRDHSSILHYLHEYET